MLSFPAVRPAADCSMGEKLSSCIAPLMKVLMAVSAISLFLMMLVTVVDVVGRSFFNIPFEGSMEWCELLMLMVAYPAFAYVQNRDHHLNVDLVCSRYSEGGQAVLSIFRMAVSFFFFCILVWQMGRQCVERFSYAEATPVLGIPLWPFYGVAALCLAFLALTVLITMLKDWHVARVQNLPVHAVLAFCFGLLLCAAPFILAGTRLGLSPGVLGAAVMFFLFVLILTGMPIGMAMMVAGLEGLLIFMPSLAMAFSMAASAPYHSVASFNMTVIPMFILLGEFALYGDVSTDLFDAAAKWVGPLPGGLAIASICGCAGFAAVCGDSVATAMTMATVSLPEMKKKNYNIAFGAASLSVGGTLGILIPPSMGFIMYAIVTEESVGKLFMAGIVPGILLTFILCGIVFVRASLDPELAPRGPRSSLGEKVRSLTKTLPMLALFTLIMGGILAGFCTPTEGGAVGAMGCLLYCLARRCISFARFYHALVTTVVLSSKIFLILIGVTILGYLLAASNLPMTLAAFITESNMGKYTLLAGIIVMYLLLGMLMNVIPMIMLILPAIFPAVVAAGFDPIWFGVITVLMMELGQITPPVGVLVFAMSSVVPDVPMSSIFRHVSWFFLGIGLCVLLLILFPQLCLFLPSIL